jgi:hypothetical protein
MGTTTSRISVRSYVQGVHAKLLRNPSSGDGKKLRIEGLCKNKQSWPIETIKEFLFHGD